MNIYLPFLRKVWTIVVVSFFANMTWAQADLELQMNVTPARYDIYTHIDVELVLENKGPATTENIKVYLPLPNGQLAFSGQSASVGLYDAWLKEWQLPSLASGETATATLRLFTLYDEQPIKLFAQVIESSIDDPDSTPDNNTTGMPVEDDEAELVLRSSNLMEEADLKLEITANTGSTYEGDEHQYRITLKNFGPSDATNVLIELNLPQGITELNYSPEFGDFSNGEWTIPSIANNETFELTIDFRVDRLDNPLIAQANIESSDVIDPTVDTPSIYTIINKREAPAIGWYFHVEPQAFINEGVDLTKLNNGTFIAVGRGAKTATSGTQIILTNFNEDGTQNWTKYFSGILDRNIQCLSSTPDGGFLLIGRRLDASGDFAGLPNQEGMFIAKFSADGENDYIIPVENYKQLLALELNDNHLVTVYVDQQNILNYTKIDRQGNEVFEKTISQFESIGINSLIKLRDNKYLICGLAKPNLPNALFHSFLLKFDEFGFEQIAIPEGDMSHAYDIAELDDGDIIVSGIANTVTADITYGLVDYMLQRLTANFDLKWQKIFGGNRDEVPFSVIVEQDGSGFALGGFSESNTGDKSRRGASPNFWIVKTDNDGIIQWEKSVGGTIAETRPFMIQSSNGNYILTGESRSNDLDFADKTSSIGNGFVLVSVNADLPPPPPQSNLSLQVLANTSSYYPRDEHQYQIRLINNGPDEATNIQVEEQFPDGITILNSTATSGNFNNDIWSIPNLAANDTIYLTIDFSVQKDGGTLENSVQIISSDSEDTDVSDDLAEVIIYGKEEAPEIRWQHIFQIDNPDSFNVTYGMQAIELANQTVLSTGRHDLPGTPLINLDQYGNVVWEKVFGDDESRTFVSAILATDDGFYLSGSIFQEPNGGDFTSLNNEDRFFLAKLDFNGNTQWIKGFSGNIDGYFSYLYENDNFLILSTAKNLANDSRERETYYLNKSGNIQFSNKFTYPANQRLFDSKLFPNGKIAFCGANNSLKPIIIIVDQDGNVVLEQNYPQFNSAGFYGLDLSHDNQIIISGNLIDNSKNFDRTAADQFELLLLKVNQINGDIIWEKKLGGSANEGTFRVRTIPNNEGYILAGSTYSQDGDIGNPAQFQDAWLVKTNTEGIIEWEKTLGGSSVDFVFRNIETTSDGGFIFAGETRSIDGDLTGFIRAPRFGHWTVKVGGTPSPLPQANLSLQVLANTSSYYPGDEHKYQIRLINNGPDEATNIQVEEQFPDGITILNSTATSGDFNNDIWSIPSLAVNDTTYLTIDFSVQKDGGTLENQVQIISSDSEDTDASDNLAEVIIYGKEEAPEITWQIKTGIPGILTAGEGGIELSNGTFITYGSTSLNTSSVLYSLSSQGEVLWEKTLPQASWFKNSIYATQDTGFVIIGVAKEAVGIFQDFPSGPTSFKAKFNSSGNLISLDRWENEPNSIGLNVKPYLNNDFIHLKSITIQNRGRNVIERLNESGQVIWSYLLTNLYEDFSFTDEGNIILVGADLQGVNPAIAKFDSNGNQLWEKIYPTNNNVYSIATEILDNNDILVLCNESGAAEAFEYNQTNILLLKTTENGDLIWEKRLGGNDFEYPTSLSKDQEDNIIISALSKEKVGDVSRSLGEIDVWVLKVSTEGEIIWENSFGGSDYDGMPFSIPTNDEGILMISGSNSSDFDLRDFPSNDLENFWVVKLGGQPSPPSTGPDLELSLSSNDTSSLTIYKPCFVTATLSNTGDEIMENIKVSWPIPRGKLAFSGQQATHGYYDSWLQEWLVGTLQPGEVATVEINWFTLDDSRPIELFAQVSQASPDDIDSTPNNNTTGVPQEDDEASYTLSPAFVQPPDTSDLSIQVLANTSSFYPGDEHIYQIRLINFGPQDAKNIQINAPLPSGTSLIKVSKDTGYFNNGVWTISSLAEGDTLFLTLDFSVIQDGGELIYLVDIVNQDGLDLENNNNDDQVIIYGKEEVPEKSWQLKLGQDSLDVAGKSAIELADGSYLAYAEIREPNRETSGLLVRISQMGDEIWRLILPSANWENNSFIATPDTGFTIAGVAYESIDIFQNFPNGSNNFIAQFDKNATLSWIKNLGTVQPSNPFNLKFHPNGGFVLLRDTLINMLDRKAIDRLNSNGEIQWTYNLPERFITDWHVSSEGDIIATGSNFPNGTDPWVLTLSSSGNLIWENVYPNETQAYGFKINTTQDGHVLVAGIEFGPNNVIGYELNNIILLKITEGGDLVWRKRYGGPGTDVPFSINIDAQGNYVLSALTFNKGGDVSAQFDRSDVWLLKLSPDGIILWDFVTGGNEYDGEPTSITTKDNGILMVTEVRSIDGDLANLSQYQGDALWVVKLGGQSTPPPPPSNGPDLELTLTGDPLDYPLYDYITVQVLLSNTGDEVASNVVVDLPFPTGFAFTRDSTTAGHYDSWLKNWTVGDVAPGTTERLTLVLFTIVNDGPQTFFTQVAEASGQDADSTPGNDFNQTADEDDEAVLVFTPLADNREQQLPYKVDAHRPLAIQRLYPNPADEEVLLEIESFLDLSTSLVLRDGKGRALNTQNLELKKGINRIQLELTKYPAGIYYLELPDSNRRNMEVKLVKIRK